MVAVGTRASNSRRTSSASGAAPDEIAVSSDRSAFSSGCVSSIWIIEGTSALPWTRCSSASFTQPAGSNQRIRMVLAWSVRCMPPQMTSRP